MDNNNNSIPFQKELPGVNGETNYERLRHVRLPNKIRALPHVLETIDALLMPFEEALVVAAATKDLLRLAELVDRFGCSCSDVLAIVADSGNGVAFKKILWLLDGICAKLTSHDVTYGHLRIAAAMSAAKNNRLDALKFLLWQIIN